MRHARDLSQLLCFIAMDARDSLADNGYSDVSLKIIALQNGKPIQKVGIVGKNDPAKIEEMCAVDNDC